MHLTAFGAVHEQSPVAMGLLSFNYAAHLLSRSATLRGQCGGRRQGNGGFAHKVPMLSWEDVESFALSGVRTVLSSERSRSVPHQAKVLYCYDTFLQIEALLKELSGKKDDQLIFGQNPGRSKSVK